MRVNKDRAQERARREDTGAAQLRLLQPRV